MISIAEQAKTGRLSKFNRKIVDESAVIQSLPTISSPKIGNTSTEVEHKYENLLKLDITSCYEELLSKGFIQSFCDLMNIIHLYQREKYSDMDIDFNRVRNLLIINEQHKRSENILGCIHAHRSLADYLKTIQQYEFCVFLYEKNLSLCRKIMDSKFETITYGDLGSLYFESQDFQLSLLNFNKQNNLAESINCSHEVTKACQSLFHTHCSVANEAEKVMSFESALSSYMDALVAVKKCNDRLAEAKINGKIGNVFIILNIPDKALDYLLVQSNIASDLGNLEEKCSAANSLTIVYDLLGVPTKAIEELQNVIQLSDQSGDIKLHAKSLLSLGHIYCKLSSFEEASNTLQNYYQLLQCYRDQFLNEEIEYAKVLVGFSKGNMNSDEYMLLIHGGVKNLLSNYLSEI